MPLQATAFLLRGPGLTTAAACRYPARRLRAEVLLNATSPASGALSFKLFIPAIDPATGAFGAYYLIGPKGQKPAVTRVLGMGAATKDGVLLTGTKDEDTGMWYGLVKNETTLVVLYMEGVEVGSCRGSAISVMAGRRRAQVPLPPCPRPCPRNRCRRRGRCKATGAPAASRTLPQEEQAKHASRWPARARHASCAVPLLSAALSTARRPPPPLPPWVQAWDANRTKVVDNQVIAQYTYTKMAPEEVQVRSQCKCRQRCSPAAGGCMRCSPLAHGTVPPACCCTAAARKPAKPSARRGLPSFGSWKTPCRSNARPAWLQPQSQDALALVAVKNAEAANESEQIAAFDRKENSASGGK